MLIRRMTAAFGRFNQETLELSDGLNILMAPNEAGKSTWCAFLSAMLYGLPTRDHGLLADKNRYAPWSGAAMQGRLDCQADGRGLTLLRETKRQTSPLGTFTALYAGTGDPVPELTGQNCGEQLLGVPREVFERSALIRQSGLSITQDAELERRILSLITTGEEDTSYIEAAEALKKQLNRRRHNRTGQLPALEAELAETRRQLDILSGAESRLAETRQEIALLIKRESDLTALLTLHDRWDAAQRRRVLADAESAAAQAAQAAADLRRQAEETRLPENETIARLRGAIVNLGTVRKSVDNAMAEKNAAMRASVNAETAVSESPFAERTPEEAQRDAQSAVRLHGRKTPAMLASAAGVAGCILLSAGLFVSLANRPGGIDLLAGLGILVLGGAGGLLFLSFYLRARKNARTAALTNRYGTADIPEISALADVYAALCQKRDEAQKAVVKTVATYDALYASLTSNEQGILLEVRRFAPAAFDIPAADEALRVCAARRKELSAAQSAMDAARLRYETMSHPLPAEVLSADAPLIPPEQSREALNSALLSVKAELSATQSAADRLSGQITALGGQAALETQAEQLSDQIEMLEGEYASIQLAMQALDSANTILQNRFSPALGRRAAEIFSELTDGRYSGVVLDRAFHLSAEPAGNSVYRDAQLLSAGTADQLYLAVRLAICELVLPAEKQVPIVLDDALANFDDARCAAALRWLRKEAGSRQILLFTCHSREAEFFRGATDVSIQQLTDVQAAV